MLGFCFSIQKQSGFNVSLNRCLNLSSQKWLKPILNLLNVLLPNFIITRATNVWIKSNWVKLMIYGKKSFGSIQFLKEIHGKCCGVCKNLSSVEVSYVYVMVAKLKGIYRTIVSYTFLSEVLKPQFLTQFITRGTFNSFCYC